MSDEHDSVQARQSGRPSSIDTFVSLDAFLDQLVADRRPTVPASTVQELKERILAAQLRLLREGVETPQSTFLRTFQNAPARRSAITQRHDGSQEVSRACALRVAVATVTTTGLLGVGVAVDKAWHTLRQPQELVSSPGRWYDIAAIEDVADGQMRGFTAGGVLGYVINVQQRLVAVSAVCTHMGCRLKPTQTPLGLRCLCHDARFSAAGVVLSGPATEPLPHITLRVMGGRIYARGSLEDTVGVVGAGLPPHPTGESGRRLLSGGGSPSIPEQAAPDR
jgi:cytochrome b6-f complex iron-sulfur subunit